MSLDLFVQTLDRIKPTLKLMTEFTNAIKNFHSYWVHGLNRTILTISEKVGAVLIQRDRQRRPRPHSATHNRVQSEYKGADRRRQGLCRLTPVPRLPSSRRHFPFPNRLSHRDQSRPEHRPLNAWHQTHRQAHTFNIFIDSRCKMSSHASAKRLR